MPGVIVGTATARVSARRDPYKRAFERFQERMKNHHESARLSYLLVPAVTLGLLWGLKSELFAVLWCAVALVPAASYGLTLLRRAVERTNETITFLNVDVRAELERPASRDELLQLLEARVNPDDLLNAPEALVQFAQRGYSAERAELAAHAVYGYSGSALERVSFLRTGMVLLGLFGTVLFFAFSLPSVDPRTQPSVAPQTQLTTAVTDRMLPHLRGALASTLVGILGSLVLGFLGSRVATLREELILETRAFISGPILQVLGTRVREVGLRNETELWEELRQEVAVMADRTAEAYGKASADLQAYSVSLQKISDQLSARPELKFPDEMSRLETATGDFARAAEALEKLVPPLVKAVDTAGRLFPEETRGGLAAIRESVAQLVTDLDAVKEMTATIDGCTGDLVLSTSEAREATARTLAHLQDNVLPVIGGLGGHVSDIAQRQQAMTQGVVEARDAANVAAQASIGARRAADQTRVELTPRVETINQGIGKLDGELDGIGAGMSVVREEVKVATEELKSLPEVVASVRRAVGQFTAAAEALKVLLPTVDRVGRDLGKLGRVVRWHERAERAPLMRLLLLPLWPEGRLPFMRRSH